MVGKIRNQKMAPAKRMFMRQGLSFFGEGRKRQLKKRTVAAGIIMTLGIVGLFVYRFLEPKEFAEAVPPPIVEIEKPQIGDISLTTSLLGKVEPSDVVYLYPKTSGDVTEVNIKAGDMVNEGDVLCRIDTKQVETAKNNLDAAALRLSQAQMELNRQSALYQSGYISIQAYEQFRDNAASAKLQHDQAKFAYETQVSYSRITAPISGLVEICDIETYDTLNPGSLICVISGEGTQVLSFQTTERIRDYLQEGDVIEAEKEGKRYGGVICEISTMADDVTGLYKVKANMNQDVALPTGAQVKIYVTCEEAKNALVIPVDAVYFEGGEPQIYIYEAGIVHKRQIEMGIYDSERAEVLGGLGKEENVIVSWSSELYDGSEAALKEESDGQEESR